MTYHRGFSWVARLTAVAIFPLVFVGAGVTSKNAGLAYPDGFTSNGHFLTNPPGWWDHDHTRWEHGHRLLGRSVGILAILTVVLAWRRGPLARTMALVTLAAIVVQGVMGALRVNQVSTLLAMIHGIWGQLCFGLASATALTASRSWIAGRATIGIPAAATLQRTCLGAAVALAIQLILGATLRHFGSDAALIAHVLWAIMVAMLVGWISMWIIGQHSLRHPIGALGCLLGGMVALQIVLGGIAWIVTLPRAPVSTRLVWFVPTAHTAVGSLILVGSVLLTLCTYRMLRCEPRAAAIQTRSTAVVGA